MGVSLVLQGAQDVISCQNSPRLFKGSSNFDLRAVDTIMHSAAGLSLEEIVETGFIVPCNKFYTSSESVKTTTTFAGLHSGLDVVTML